MNDRMMRAMAMFGGDDDDAPKLSPLPEAVIAELKLMSETYMAHMSECPFKPGDIVTPLLGSTMKGAGKPHVVLETISNPDPVFTDELGLCAFGRRPNLRVGLFQDGKRPAFWVESFEFELYSTAEQRKADEAAAGLRAVQAA